VTCRDNYGFTHIVRLLCWWCCLWSSKRMAAIRKSRLLLTCNICSLGFARFAPWACINGIFVSIVFFATYDDTKGSTFIYLGRDRLRTPYRHLRMIEGCPCDTRTIVHIARAPWGNRGNIVRCLYSDRIEIVRASCDFSGGKIRRPYCHRIRQSCGLRAAPVRCCLRWIYTFTRYDAYGES